mgnify:CR=1 FL=1
MFDLKIPGITAVVQRTGSVQRHHMLNCILEVSSSRRISYLERKSVIVILSYKVYAGGLFLNAFVNVKYMHTLVLLSKLHKKDKD